MFLNVLKKTSDFINKFKGELPTQRPYIKERRK